LRLAFGLVDVAVVARGHWTLGAFDTFYSGFRPCFLRLGFLFLLRLGSHGGYAIDRSGDVGEGSAVSISSLVFETDVFGVMEVCGECARDGEEFVFDHYVDVVGGEAGAHGFFGWRFGWRGGGW